MKKLLSAVIAAMLMLSCSTATFSATDSTASPDEAKKLVSMEMTELPSKLDYILFLDAGWNFDIDENETDPDKILDAINNAEFYINVDLTGATIMGTYSDGTTEEIDPDLCTTSVADPVNLGEINKEEDIEKALAMVYREYTINVELYGVTTSFNVTVDPYDFDYSDIYEFVSYTEPDKNIYDIDKDFSQEILFDEEDNEIIVDSLDFDLTGMTVTIKNKETGELITYGEDNIYLNFMHFPDDPELVPGEYTAFGEVYTDDGEIVPFDYLFKLISTDDNKTPAPSNPSSDSTLENNSKKPVSKTDTPDTAVNTSADNGAIQTGNPVSAGILAVVMLSGTMIAFLTYRKKFER